MSNIEQRKAGNRARAGKVNGSRKGDGLRAKRSLIKQSANASSLAEVGDVNAKQAKRVTSRLPSSLIDTSPVLDKSKSVPWSRLTFTHFEGDRDDKGYWFDRGSPCLFDDCQNGMGQSEDEQELIRAQMFPRARKGQWVNLWVMPRSVVPCDGRVLAREAERDELDLLLLDYRMRTVHGEEMVALYRHRVPG